MKKILIKNGEVFYQGKLQKLDILLSRGKVKSIKTHIKKKRNVTIINASKLTVIPGLIDIHVHLREPGFEYKEDIASGTHAAAAGGYTTICSMPNLNPPTDTKKRLKRQLELIKENAIINVLPYSSITIGRIGKDRTVDFAQNAKYAFAFSDDGTGIQEEDLMRYAMKEAKNVNKHIVAHCEDIRKVKNGCVHDGEYAKKHELRGISSDSEYSQIERDIKLAQETRCRYHICHISTKEGVRMVRKAANPNITCEVTPHHLVFNDSIIQDNGAFKMNPPIRSIEDQKELILGVMDGTISLICTDHAPHSESEKDKGLQDSAFGISGLETALPIIYTYLVRQKIISFDKMIDLMSLNASKLFDIPSNEIIKGKQVDLAIVDFKTKFKINRLQTYSKSKITPFDKWDCYGKPKYTICKGKVVFGGAN